MRIVKGDLLKLGIEGRFDVLVHGANCQCAMGAGIAKTIREIFPEAYEADLQTPKGDRAKLGTISCAQVRREGHSLWIVNAYTQLHYRGAGVRVDYDAVRSAMRLVKQQFTGKRIGYPRIGAGLARGDWTQLARIIDEELDGEDHTRTSHPDRARGSSRARPHAPVPHARRRCVTSPSSPRAGEAWPWCWSSTTARTCWSATETSSR